MPGGSLHVSEENGGIVHLGEREMGALRGGLGGEAAVWLYCTREEQSKS